MCAALVDCSLLAPLSRYPLSVRRDRQWPKLKSCRLDGSCFWSAPTAQSDVPLPHSACVCVSPPSSAMISPRPRRSAPAWVALLPPRVSVLGCRIAVRRPSRRSHEMDGCGDDPVELLSGWQAGTTISAYCHQRPLPVENAHLMPDRESIEESRFFSLLLPYVQRSDALAHCATREAATGWLYQFQQRISQSTH